MSNINSVMTHYISLCESVDVAQVLE